MLHSVHCDDAYLTESKNAREHTQLIRRGCLFFEDSAFRCLPSLAIVLVLLGCCPGGEAYMRVSLCGSGPQHAGALRAHPVASMHGSAPSVPPAAAPAAAGPDCAVSRRSAMLAGAALLAAGTAPRAGYAYDFKKVTSGDALFDVPALWKQTGGDAGQGTFAFADPVSGKVLDQITVREYEAPAGFTSTKDAGKIEKVLPSKAFGATKEVRAPAGGVRREGLRRYLRRKASVRVCGMPCSGADSYLPHLRCVQVDKADMVAASVRKGTESKTGESWWRSPARFVSSTRWDGVRESEHKRRERARESEHKPFVKRPFLTPFLDLTLLVFDDYDFGISS